MPLLWSSYILDDRVHKSRLLNIAGRHRRTLTFFYQKGICVGNKISHCWNSVARQEHCHWMKLLIVLISRVTKS
jgi:hypothetical protein